MIVVGVSVPVWNSRLLNGRPLFRRSQDLSGSGLRKVNGGYPLAPMFSLLPAVAVDRNPIVG